MVFSVVYRQRPCESLADFGFRQWHCNFSNQSNSISFVLAEKKWNCWIVKDSIISLGQWKNLHQQIHESEALNSYATDFCSIYRLNFCLTVETRINKRNRLLFSDELSPYQGNCSTWVSSLDNLWPYLANLLHSNKFSKQVVASGGKIVPLDLFSQTSCLWKLNHLKKFLRQSFTIIWELVSLEKLPRKTSSIRFISTQKKQTFGS